MTQGQLPCEDGNDLRAEALLRITDAIETAATLDELLMLGLNEFSRLLDLTNSGVILLADNGDSARLVSTSPPRNDLPPAFRVADTIIIRRVLTERETIYIADVRTELAGPNVGYAIRNLLPLLSSEQICSLLLLPLVAQDRCIGMLVFASVQQPRSFNPAEVAQARLLAGQLAAAITSFRITAEAHRRAAELATLNQIATAVTSSLNTHEVYHIVMEKINAFFQVDGGSLLMLDQERNELVFVMTLEAGEEKLFGVRIPRGQGVVWSVAENQCYEIVNDAINDPRVLQEVSASVGYVTRNLLCVPIVVKGHTIGVIELINKHAGDFTEEEAVLLTRMAPTIGVAIENARLFQTVTTVRDRLKAILDSTNDAILMADMDNVVVTTNPAAARLFLVPREALIGIPLAELLNALRARAASAGIPSWLANNNTQQVLELELAMPQRRFIRHYMLTVRDAHATEIGCLAIFQDISQERELHQLREDYAGMLVHDLRAPLTAIMNGIMMVKRGLGGPISEQQQELLSIAHQGSQSMLEMVNTLLDIAKLEQGHMNLEREPLSPYDLIDQTLERLRGSAQAQRVPLNQELSVGLPLFEADRNKMVRVLQNLLDNAIKFSPSDKVVTLGANFVQINQESQPEQTTSPSHIELQRLTPGNWLIFWVNDQGPGIAPQYHERIFDKFGQVSGGRKVRGTGLGLTFCKLAIEAHGGRIWVQSAEGAGSTFVVALRLE
ncbi:GAF domain-containing protein [Candidatus Viridilinea mediisalina]|uniref:histidine kinase n=1 Tax=Candidatus Viridilinea mediisalina TaxID=2024553 RepID=A0A2A6RGH9_9CHLR|nr:GAF domain-containing protein [Candidatus Viridilinea mediisalina]PDW02043.1 histidine kinase [Candidatus Viridilinea mediisalina]